MLPAGFGLARDGRRSGRGVARGVQGCAVQRFLLMLRGAVTPRACAAPGSAFRGIKPRMPVPLPSVDSIYKAGALSDPNFQPSGSPLHAVLRLSPPPSSPTTLPTI